MTDALLKIRMHTSTEEPHDRCTVEEKREVPRRRPEEHTHRGFRIEFRMDLVINRIYPKEH